MLHKSTDREKTKILLLSKNLYQPVEAYWLFLRDANPELSFGQVIDQITARLNAGSAIEDIVKFFAAKHQTEKNAFFDAKIDDTTRRLVEDLNKKIENEASFFKSKITFEIMQRPVLPGCGHYHEEKEFESVHYRCILCREITASRDCFFDADFAKACESFSREPGFKFYENLKSGVKLPKDLKSFAEGYEQRRLAREKPFMKKFECIHLRYTELARPTLDIKPLAKEFQFKKIAVTECGHYVELENKACTECKAEFKYPPVEFRELTDFVKNANEEYESLVYKVPIPRNFRETVILYNQRFLFHSTSVVKQNYMQAIAYKLQINVCEANYAMWDEKTHRGFFNKGGNEVNYNGKMYKIPKRIEHMMSAVGTAWGRVQHRTVEEFWQVLHQARKDYSYNPFLTFFRDTETKALLDLDDKEFVKAVVKRNP